MSDETKQPAPEPPQGFLKRYGFILGYWLIFIGILGSLVAANEIYPDLVTVHASRATASLLGFIMGILGATSTVEGITITNVHCRFHIISECTAYFPVAIFLASVLAYPCRVRAKLIGVFAGVPIVLLFNMGRLVTLCYVRSYYPKLFDTIHILIWQSLIIFFTVFLWILWVSTVASRHETRSS